jgi:hypothetical protein
MEDLMTTQLATIPADSLATASGGFLSRADFQAGGRNLAEAGVVGAGAAGGFALGGAGGAFAGATGAELLNRSGATGSFGEWAGGKTFDAISQPPQLDTSGGPLP